MSNIKKGERLFKQGNVDEAENLFLCLLSEDPTNAEILNNLGVIHYNKGNVKQCENYFVRALGARKENLDALLNLADLYQEQGRFVESVDCLEKYISMGTKDIDILDRLKKLYLKIKNTCINGSEQKEKVEEPITKHENVHPENKKHSLAKKEDYFASVVDRSLKQESNLKGRSKIRGQRMGNEPHFSVEKIDLNQISDQLRKNYQVNKPVGLLLKHNESIQDYMNLEYYLKNHGNIVSQKSLFYLLQTAFHKIISSYFNSMSISKTDRSNAFAILNFLGYRKKIGNSMKEISNESFIYILFHFLKEYLPRTDEKKVVSLMDMKETLDNNEATDSIVHIYHSLKKEFQILYDNKFISSFMIHGSISTLDYTPFSDIDTQLFLSDNTFSSPDTIKQVAKFITKANIHIKLFDPIQHHGYFVSTDLDCSAYPQSYLPLQVMENATAVLGGKEYTFLMRSCDYENKLSLWNLSYFFRVSFLYRNFPENPFDMKRFLSRFMMLPILYLELFEDIYPYKRDAFKIAEKYFPQTVWNVFEIASRAREKWNPTRLLRFNYTFYKSVFEFAELMLHRLQELSNESAEN